MKKYLKWIVLALLIFFVINAPEQAANSAKNIGSMGKDAGDSATTFFTKIVPQR